MKNKKGFTLIELLVVIAIIGLLSTMAVVSLNSARGKARDAQRLSDVKQLSTVIEMAAASGGDYNIFPGTGGTCGAAGDLTTTCGTIEGNDFSVFMDPVEAQRTQRCDGGAVNTPCGYTMMLASQDDAYEICFWLEMESGDLVAGLTKVTEGSRITNGCTDIVLP